jgi:DDE superfamily endonuclease
MRRASARRAAWCGNGRDGERARASWPTSVTRAPICSAPFCPARGVGAALALPCANTEAMQLQLDEISANAAARAHAALIFDRAGWHTTPNLLVPENITPVWLPSRAPELNPVENVRANWLSNRVFETFDDIIEAICEGWNKLTAQPETISSIGIRRWAGVGQS